MICGNEIDDVMRICCRELWSQKHDVNVVGPVSVKPHTVRLYPVGRLMVIQL